MGQPFFDVHESRSRRLAMVILCSLLVPLAATGAQDDHAPLSRSAALTYEEVFASAMRQAPEALESPVRELQAEAFNANGRSLVAGRPSLQISYYDDSPLDAVGLTEMEFGVQLPLWRPGQRRNMRQIGEQYDEQLDAWQAALALSVAGRVRSVLADIAAAELALELQQQAVADAGQLNDVTQTLFEAGEVARLDALQARTLLLDQRAMLLAAQAALVDAERLYVTLTGLDTRPVAVYEESQVPDRAINNAHPALAYLQTGIDLARGNVAQSEANARGNPQLTIGTRRERGDRFQDPISSIGVSLNIPFGGGSWVSAQTSSARKAQVDAEVAHRQAYLQLNQALHEVEHELLVVDDAIVLREEQQTLTSQRYDMALTAYELSESTLAEVVIARQQAMESRRALETARLDRQRLITEYNQLLGELP